MKDNITRTGNIVLRHSELSALGFSEAEINEYKKLHRRIGFHVVYRPDDGTYIKLNKWSIESVTLAKLHEILG